MIKNSQSIEMMIREHPFFATIHSDHLKIVAEDAELKIFEPEEILFRETEPANRLFLIESGKVVLETRSRLGEKMFIETLGDGDVVGWSWLIPPFSLRFQARTLESTKMIIINGAHLLVTGEKNTEFGYRLMRRVAQLMAHRLETLRCRLFEEHEGSMNEPAMRK